MADADVLRDELDAYARALFDNADGWIEVRCIPDGAGDIRIHWYESVGALVADYARLVAENKVRHVFIGVNPRPKRRGIKADMERGTCCHVELDLGKDGDTRSELMRRLERLPMLATVVVDSGSGGLHAYWRLTEPASQVEIEQVNRALALRVGAHDSVHDITRVLRPPGFTNIKPHVMAPARLLHLPGGTVDISELADELEPEIAAAVRAEKACPAGAVAPESPVPLEHRIRRATAYVRTMPEAVSGQGGHEATWRAAVAVVRGFLVPPDAAMHILHEYNSRCQPPWTESDLAHKIESASTTSTTPWGYLLAQPTRLEVVGGEGRPSEPAPGGVYSGELRVVDTCTDVGNAERFVRQHGHDLRWHLGAEVWYEWDGTRWVKGDRGRTNALRRAKVTTAAIREEAAAYEEGNKPDLAKILGDWWRTSSSLNRLNNMHRLATAEEALAVDHGSFDKAPWLFNCANGTVDLRTGQIHPHRRDDMLTQVSRAEFDLFATCEVWDRYLETSLDPEVAGYLQRVAGYTLTGLTSEEKLWLHFGAGRNGKGVFQHAMQQILGNYSYTAAFATFIRARRVQSGNNDDVADLAGRRAVWASESDQGERLNESLIKALTGGDRIFAMRKHEHSFEFLPTFKIHLSTNHRPDVHGADEGIKSRPRIVPWDRVIPASERDPALKAKLSTPEALRGILAWAVKGCLDWQRYGLEEPPQVTAATQAWWEDTDILGDWMRERCVVQDGAFEAGKALYESYLRWCEDQHQQAVRRKTFAQALTERGYQTERDTDKSRTRGHLGLRLRGIGDA